MLSNVVFLDLETTGGSATHDRIIDVGLIEIRNGAVVDEWSTLVNPGRRIPHGIQTLTGITDEMVADAPSFESLSEGLAQRLDGKVLAAHNARFDYGFLKHAFRRAGVRYAAPVLCTVKLSRRLFPQHRRHNLDALIIRHALFCLDRHRGLGDARVLWELTQIWTRELGAEALHDACAALLKGPTVPAGLPPDIFDELPEGPGVYVFYGEDDVVLYVGRSANMQARVMVHFSEGGRGGKDRQIAEEVKRIECIEAAGELGAFFVETRLLKRLAPKYRRQSGPGHELCAWRWQPENPGAAPELVAVSDIDASESSALYGVFRSRAAALAALRGLTKAHRLCRAAVGLEPRAGGACSAHPAGHCRGICIGAESVLSHAMRLTQALAGLRLRPWPYAGRIGVRERNRDTRRTELHVIDRWRYLGTVRTEAELRELADEPVRGNFDLDTYKMLARFLRAPPATCDIVPLEKGVTS